MPNWHTGEWLHNGICDLVDEGGKLRRVPFEPFVEELHRWQRLLNRVTTLDEDPFSDPVELQDVVWTPRDDFRWSRTRTGREACDPPEMKVRLHIPPHTLASRSRSTSFVHRPRVTSATTSSGLSATWSGPAASRAALGNGPHAAAIVRMPAARPAATSCTLSPT